MTFTLLPAVDVADGRAVRLVQGQAGTETASVDPADAALAWQADGAEWIHLVDLDAAFGRGSNTELLASVIAQTDAKVELSGGISDDESLNAALASGCDRVVLSTAALADPTWTKRTIAAHGETIAVALDVRLVKQPDGTETGGTVEHRLAARGGSGDTGELWETLEQLDSVGCARYIVTDVSQDGTLRGPNVELYRAVTNATSAPVIASGGVSAISDLVVLAEIAALGANLEGAIVGKALYAGRFTLPAALKAMRDSV